MNREVARPFFYFKKRLNRIRPPAVNKSYLLTLYCNPDAAFMQKQVFITGGTGYLGKRLINQLLKLDYEVKALCRKGSEMKLPKACIAVAGNPFDAESFQSQIPAGCTFIQLLGVPHPSPKKKHLFEIIDLASAKASVQAAKAASCKHFVYISVAQEPTKIMMNYQQCRAQAENLIKDSGLKATILRPWYIIGPGHYWPLFFLPVFKMLEWLPATSARAKALRLVYLKQMLATLIKAVENPTKQGIKVVEIAEIRKS